MAAADPSDRQTCARIGAHARWANAEDRAAETAPARKAFNDRFEQQVDPDGVMKPEVRQKLAANARSAHFSRLALRSAQLRRARKTEAKPKRRAS